MIEAGLILAFLAALTAGIWLPLAAGRLARYFADDDEAQGEAAAGKKWYNSVNAEEKETVDSGRKADQNKAGSKYGQGTYSCLPVHLPVKHPDH